MTMKLVRTPLIVILLFLVLSCTKEQYGGAIDHSAPLVKVKDVYFMPSLRDKKVNLKGIIITQCQSSGCWFFINDGTGQVFINLAPKGFTLPPKTGKQAMVTGTVADTEQGKMIIAEAVEIY